MTQTLQDLRKAKFPTIKAFASAYGVSTPKASYLLRGRYQYTITKGEVQRLYDVFEVSFDDAVDAVNNTYLENKEWVLARDWKLKDRWERQERIYAEYVKWKKQRDQGQMYTIFLPDRYNIFGSLGLTSNATETDIRTAFRNKAKALSDGKGGYNGDMDRLVQAKEKALAYVKGQRA